MDKEQVIKECTFTFSRSGGKGGQHVNKVATRAELWWDLSTSSAVDDEERKTLFEKLPKRYLHDTLVHLSSGQSRSQNANRVYVQEKLIEVLTRALTPVKRRRPTKKTAAANRKRLEQKARKGTLKASRRDPRLDD